MAIFNKTTLEGPAAAGRCLLPTQAGSIPLAGPENLPLPLANGTTPEKPGIRRRPSVVAPFIGGTQR